MRDQPVPESPPSVRAARSAAEKRPCLHASPSAPNILKHFRDYAGGKGEKREVLLLVRCIRLLRPGGRMAVVIPEGLLSNKNDGRLRKFIQDECIIKAVIRLPQDAFKMSEGAACTSVLFVVKKDPDAGLTKQSDIFFARDEYIGISPSGRPIDKNDLLAIKEHYRKFEAGHWDGVEMKSTGNDKMTVIRAVPSGDQSVWLEPEVNRTSLLYDRLSYVVREPELVDRFSYTWFHPAYYRIVKAIQDATVPNVTLESLCIVGYLAERNPPRRFAYRSPGEFGVDQSSTDKFGTCPKSCRFRVTTVAWDSNATAAMARSCFPTRRNVFLNAK